jgi:hypothetical protein
MNPRELFDLPEHLFLGPTESTGRKAFEHLSAPLSILCKTCEYSLKKH